MRQSLTRDCSVWKASWGRAVAPEPVKSPETSERGWQTEEEGRESKENNCCVGQVGICR